ncbi:MAG: hypothetical protein GXX96_12050 [Planctomycetaceae bacterium]|jgi:hypothetical protein|nr:hypothetical protein [Planctomycetaceae bacterium]
MTIKLISLLTGLGMSALLIGCGSAQDGANGNPGGPVGVVHDHEAEHDHDVPGPHGGHIIVLGDEAYHAELTHDEATHTVAVYLLDKTGKTPISDSPEELVLQVFEKGDFADHVLKASDREGMYAVIDEALCDMLSHDEPLRGRIRVTIAGQEYVGIVEHAAHASGDEATHDHGAEDAEHDQSRG